MREKYGVSVDAAFDAIDADVEQGLREAEDQGPDPRDVERVRRRAEKARKRAAKLARGQYPVRVADPDGAGPREQQEAAFEHLIDHEAAVLEAVLAQVSRA
jgi:hypothetical protein